MFLICTILDFWILIITLNKDLVLIGIFSIGIAQGLFLLVAILLLKDRRRITIISLVCIILCFLSLILTEQLKLVFSIEEVITIFRLGETIPLLIGPLFFIYFRSIINIEAFSKRILLHFVPFVSFFFVFLPFYLQTDSNKLEYLRTVDQNGMMISTILFSIFKALHTLVYLLYCWWYVKRHSKPKEVVTKKLSLRIIGIQLAAVVLIYLIVIMENFIVSLESDQIASGLFTLSFMLFGLLIILDSNTLIPPDRSKLKLNKYKESSLKPKDKEMILTRLEEILANEKPYLNPDLNMQDLAVRLNLSVNALSQVINEKLDKNFHQLINEYRVSEVKNNIHDHSKTLLGVALDSGFKSKSAFNRIFKELTGLTPSKYKKNL